MATVERPRTMLEGPNPHFSRFCRARNLAMRTNCAFAKTMIFPKFFLWFLHIASFVLQPQNDAKSFPEPVEQSFLRRWCSKRVLAWILGGFGALLSVTWPAFVRSWAAPGLSWVLLGRLLGTSWALLAVSWLLCGASGPDVGSLDRPRPRFLRGSGRPRLSFERFSKLF